MNDEMERAIIPDEVGSHPTWTRLNEQLNWYDHKSSSNQTAYKCFTFAKLVLAGLLPILALGSESLPGHPDSKLTIAIVGLLIALIEGVSQANQSASLWVQYRKTAEQLKHERWLFLARSGPYRGHTAASALLLLAERVEDLVSTEQGAWVSTTSTAASHPVRDAPAATS